MVDSKENYKFDLGVKGLNRDPILDAYNTPKDARWIYCDINFVKKKNKQNTIISVKITSVRRNGSQNGNNVRPTDFARQPWPLLSDHHRLPHFLWV